MLNKTRIRMKLESGEKPKLVNELQWCMDVLLWHKNRKFPRFYSGVAHLCAHALSFLCLRSSFPWRMHNNHNIDNNTGAYMCSSYIMADRKTRGPL